MSKIDLDALEALANSTAPHSPFQTEAELTGASSMCDAEGNSVPYADLMRHASRQLSTFRNATLTLIEMAKLGTRNHRPGIGAHNERRD